MFTTLQYGDKSCAARQMSAGKGTLIMFILVNTTAAFSLPKWLKGWTMGYHVQLICSNKTNSLCAQ